MAEFYPLEVLAGLIRKTSTGRDWLAAHGRPIVEGDPINDMKIEGDPWSRNRGIEARENLTAMLPTERVDWAKEPQRMRDTFSRPLPPGFTDPLADLARLICQDPGFSVPRDDMPWCVRCGCYHHASAPHVGETPGHDKVTEALIGIRHVIVTYGGGDAKIGPNEARAAFAKIEALACAGLMAVKP